MMERHGGKGASRRLGKNPFTLTCCLDRQRAERCGSRLQCRILVNAARAPCRNLATFRCACCKFGCRSGKVCKESNRNTYKRTCRVPVLCHSFRLLCAASEE